MNSRFRFFWCHEKVINNSIQATTKAELLQLKLIHLFDRELLLIKKLEIEETKYTFIISVLKVEY